MPKPKEKNLWFYWFTIKSENSNYIYYSLKICVGSQFSTTHGRAGYIRKMDYITMNLKDHLLGFSKTEWTTIIVIIMATLLTNRSVGYSLHFPPLPSRKWSISKCNTPVCVGLKLSAPRWNCNLPGTENLEKEVHFLFWFFWWRWKRVLD